MEKPRVTAIPDAPVNDVRNLSINVLTHIAVNEAGILQRANYRVTSEIIRMFGWEIKWIPDFDTVSGFQQVMIPTISVTKQLACQGKEKLYLEAGFTPKEFEIMYHHKGPADKFSKVTIGMLHTIMNHPKTDEIYQALEAYDRDVDWKSWAVKYWHLFEKTGVVPDRLLSLKIMVHALNNTKPPVEKSLSETLGSKFKVKTQKPKSKPGGKKFSHDFPIDVPPVKAELPESNHSVAKMFLGENGDGTVSIKDLREKKESVVYRIETPVDKPTGGFIPMSSDEAASFGGDTTHA